MRFYPSFLISLCTNITCILTNETHRSRSSQKKKQIWLCMFYLPGIFLLVWSTWCMEDFGLFPLGFLALLTHFLRMCLFSFTLHWYLSAFLLLPEDLCLSCLDLGWLDHTLGNVGKKKHRQMMRFLYIYIYTILPKVLGHPLLMKGLTTLVISYFSKVIGVWWWIFGSRSAFKVTPEVFSWD